MITFDKPVDVKKAVQTNFSNVTVLVVGDLMLDRYIWGDVSRISPEAPVPVVRYKRQSENVGGAGNVAMNLVGLGAQVKVAGFLGEDSEKSTILEMLKEYKIDTNCIITTNGHPTTVKTRIIGGHQQVLRLDVEPNDLPTASESMQLLAAILSCMDRRLDVIILSDYAKGVLSEHLCKSIIQEGRLRHIPVLADPKGHNYAKYANATTLSPNRAELAIATNTPTHDIDTLLDRGEQLRQSLGLEFLTFTRSEQGITLLEPGKISHAPATAREVFDVSGAGDTVIATMAVSLAVGLSSLDSIRLANLAAGIVVGKIGTVPIDRLELLSELEHETHASQPATNIQLISIAAKIHELDSLQKSIRIWRANGEKIVFTNGCFDLLHAGHVSYLEQAKRAGDRLIVGLNSDDSVRRLKGPIRPLNSTVDRAFVLAALTSVDAVIVFEEDTPLTLICSLHPDVLIKGADYSEEQVVGAKEVKSWGGSVVLIPILAGRSTTETIRKMREEN